MYSGVYYGESLATCFHLHCSFETKPSFLAAGTRHLPLLLLLAVAAAAVSRRSMNLIAASREESALGFCCGYFKPGVFIGEVMKSSRQSTENDPPAATLLRAPPVPRATKHSLVFCSSIFNLFLR